MENRHILVTGGAGYVGAVLVPRLLEKGYEVTVLDTFWFWDSEEAFLKAIGVAGNKKLTVVSGDMREAETVKNALEGVDSVIHLACLSNDPSSELDKDYTHAVNHDGALQVVDLAKTAGVTRFIYASSSSVYGIKEEPNVTEDLELEPLTQYSELKVAVERHLLGARNAKFKAVVVRPSTVCGYSPRQRLDVVVNILTNYALNKGRIKVFGGEQLRPNIHITDMVRVYELLLEAPLEKIDGKVYNAGYENLKVKEIAALVREVIGDVDVEVVPTDDIRSYHVCSKRIEEDLGFKNEHTVREAIQDLKQAFEDGRIVDDERCYNIKVMQRVIAGEE